MKNFIKTFFYSMAIFFISSLYSGCKKIVEIDLPTDRITGDAVFDADGTANSFVTGTYATIGSKSIDGFLSLSFLAGLSSDELRIMDAQTFAIWPACYKYKLNSTGSASVSTPEYWSVLYGFIYRANTAIEGLSKSSTLSPSIKQTLMGEAKFMRGYLYFYLLNLYGDVPLLTTSDWRINNSSPRTTKALVYQQIIADLKDAGVLLSPNYLAGDLKSFTTDRVRPNKWAALAMLSRVYLYNNQNKEAEDVATEVINSPNFKLPTLSNAFLRSSNEVIWSIQPTEPSRNTQEGARFLLTGIPTINVLHPFFLNPDLVNSFESGDPRKIEWIGSLTAGNSTYFYPTKYKADGTAGGPQTEYSVLLRLGEVYLNRAEARARQNHIQDCVSDLNMIRTRARGAEPITVLPDYSSNIDQTQALDACLKERRFELFTELGHRWFDIKRFGIVNQIMTPAATSKGTVWDKNWQLYPIPQGDILYNSALSGGQNPGY